MVWLGLLTSNACLLAEFILATEAAHVLLANFSGPIIIIVSRKLHEWKCALNGWSFCWRDFKFECTITQNTKVTTRKFKEILTLILQPLSIYYKFSVNSGKM